MTDKSQASPVRRTRKTKEMTAAELKAQKAAEKKKKMEAMPNWKKGIVNAAAKKRGKEEPIEREWAGNHVGPNNPQSVEKTRKTNMLKALIEPKTKAMVEVMIQIAEDKKVHPSIRLESASRLLDRVYGKPKEHVTIEDDRDMSTDGDEVAALLNRILEQVGAPLLEAPDAAAAPASGAQDQTTE